MAAAGDGEFGLIAEFFAPLAAGRAEALGLRDDAAWVASRPGFDLIVTTDALVAGVHFLADDPADLIARKLIGVNLSDLAAKGAVPDAYVLTVALPAPDRPWLARFAEGLRADQAEYGIGLIGGDTVSTPGPLTLSATAFGWVAAGRMIRRAGARPGDRIYVSGTLGDAALGLAVLRGAHAALPAADAAWLAARYRRPRPRVGLGPALVGLAHAAADVSDGLVADLGHICIASGVDADLVADRLPLSAAARAVRAMDGDATAAALAGGDDYEIVFTAPPARAAAIDALSRRLGLALTEIGAIVAGDGTVRLRDAAGRTLAPPAAGWDHFATARLSGGTATEP